MHGVQRLVSRRDVIVSTVTAGAFAVMGIPRLHPASIDGGFADVRLPASPVATPVADAIELTIEAIGLRLSPSAISIPVRTPIRICSPTGAGGATIS